MTQGKETGPGTELFNFTKHCGAVSPRSRLFFPACYALVSGGKDSLTAAQVLHENGKLLGCISFRTGIATPDWEPFVVETCAKRGWKHDIIT